MNKKILLSIALCALVLILSVSYLSATTNTTCGYHNHSGCKKTTETIVEGKITLQANNKAVGNVAITVVCTHDKVDYTRTTTSSNSRALKGTYLVTFPQSQCKDNDMITVTAKTSDGSIGTSIGHVRDFITEKCLDIDVALVNVKIPIAPEFNLLAGALTIFGAVGMFFFVRRK